MSSVIEYLRQFHFASVAVRLLLAVLCGFVLGFGRARKQRNAGLRTYMLVSIGAALTMLISDYEYTMICGAWSHMPDITEWKFDGTRYAAQVISGIGFLAAGTILSAAHQQISGLTTAIGLFAAAALGIAAGAGFYEVPLIAGVLIVIAMEVMQPAEVGFKRRLHYITVFVEFDSIDDVGTITNTINELGAQIFDIEIERSERVKDRYPSAILTMKLGKDNPSHSAMLSSVAELPCVYAVRELIS